jgi:transposase-like protein
MNFDSFGKGAAEPPRGTEAAIPTVCPACQSPSISTTARKPDDNSYWRCSSCGEVWNAARRTARPARTNPWR